MKQKQRQPLHPLAAVRIFQKYLVLLFVPLLRALLLWQLDALWLALRQEAVLLCLLFGYTALVWRSSGWWYSQSRLPTLTITRGVFLRETLTIQTNWLYMIATERTLALRLVGASRVQLYYQNRPNRNTRQAHQNKAGVAQLVLRRADALTLTDYLLGAEPTSPTVPQVTPPTTTPCTPPIVSPSIALHSASPTGAAPTRQRRSLFAFFGKTGLLLSLCAFGFSLTKSAVSRMTFALAFCYFLGQLPLCYYGFTHEGMIKQGKNLYLILQHGYTIERTVLCHTLPPATLWQSPFARRAGRATLYFMPLNGKKVKIRSVLLKNVQALYKKN